MRQQKGNSSQWQQGMSHGQQGMSHWQLWAWLAPRGREEEEVKAISPTNKVGVSAGMRLQLQEEALGQVKDS